MDTSQTYKGTQAIRRSNLRLILREQFDNNQRRLSEAYGCPPSFISRLLKPGPGSKTIGESLARAIEALAEKPRHWLDHDHDQEQATEQTSAIAATATSETSPRLVQWSDLERLKMTRNPQLIAQAGNAAPPYPPVGKHAFYLMVEDQSMEPRLRRRERVLIDPDAPRAPGDFVLAFAGKEQIPLLRQYMLDAEGDQWLLAINPMWPEIMLAEGDWVVGKIVYKCESFPPFCINKV